MRVFTEDDDSEDGHPGVLEQGVVGEAVREGGHVEEGVQDPASVRIEVEKMGLEVEELLDQLHSMEVEK